MALAMGVEMAIARLGVTAVFFLSPRLAAIAPESVVRPVAVVGALLCIGFLTFLVFTFMDRKLDRQMGNIEEIEEDKFKVKDLGNLFGSKTFMIVAFLCVLYYSAIFPFQKFAVPMLQNTLAISSQEASDLFAWFPIGAMILTPLLGAFLDFRGKGATMLILGAILMCACHLTFALVPLTKPIAYIAIILLGVSFSLVPAALWPSVPKLVDGRYLGSGYSVIFWIQNLGLWAFPLIIGKTLQATNPGVSEQIQAGVEGVTYNYTVPMLVFASLGVLALHLCPGRLPDSFRTRSVEHPPPTGRHPLSGDAFLWTFPAACPVLRPAFRPRPAPSDAACRYRTRWFPPVRNPAVCGQDRHFSPECAHSLRA